MSSFDTEIGEDVGDGLGISEAEDMEDVAEYVMGLISQNMKNLEDGKTGSSSPNNGIVTVA